VRAGVGLAYSKYQSSSDDAFKIVPLNAADFSASAEKLRFGLIDSDGRDIYFKCKSIEEFQQWTDAIRKQMGVDPTSINPGTASSRNASFIAARAAAVADRQSAKSDDAEILSGDSGRQQEHPASPLISPRIVAATGSVGTTTTTAQQAKDDDIDIALDEESAHELQDLCSDVPILVYVPPTNATNRSNRPRSVDGGLSDLPNWAPATLESISATYHPTADTPGIETEVDRYLDTCVTYGLPAMVSRLQSRMLLPVVAPFEAVEKHITILCLDMDNLRTALSELLRRYGHEACIRDVVLTVDRTLRIFRHVRERLLVRKNIAAYREQKTKRLPHGIDGSLRFVAKLIAHERGAPSAENWQRVRELVVVLIERLAEFRLEFDVFDESLRTVLDMEQCIQDAHDWLVVHESIIR
jgi:hypothetical protein